MKDNLYTFSKNGWFVQFFKWTYGVDPVQRFKSFCPLFWVSLLTLLFLPVILCVKIFGKAGSRLLNNIHESKERNKDKARSKFIQRCNNALTPKQCYELYNSNCWWEYSRNISDELYDKIRDLANIYKSTLETNKVIQKQKLNKLKQNTTFQNICGVIFGMIIAVVLYYVFILCRFTYNEVNWLSLGKALIIILTISGISLAVFYIFNSIADYLKCKKCSICEWNIWGYIGNFFQVISVGIKIFIDMIKNFYHNNCPIITWKD